MLQVARPASAAEILGVTPLLVSPTLLSRFAVMSPLPGTSNPTQAFLIDGWILPGATPCTAVQLVGEGVALRKVNISRRAPAGFNVGELPPGALYFTVPIGILGLAVQFELTLEAVLVDGRRVPFSVISGRRGAVEAGYDPRLQPILVSPFFGRTGSTWLMHLLAQHSEIVAHRQYPYETRAASYWMHLLTVLSQPADHGASAEPNSFAASLQWVGYHPFYTESTLRLAATPGSEPYWFGRDYVDRLVAFAQQTLDSHYLGVAARQAQSTPRYFTEKFQLPHVRNVTRSIYPAAREIFLVRDFRDVICSALAFNAKRGFAAFGREQAVDDEDYIRQRRARLETEMREFQAQSGRALLVRYEDLVRQSERTLCSILTYLDLDADSSVARRILQTASRTMSQELGFHSTSASPEASIGRWRHELSPQLIRACDEVFADALSAFGYEPSASSSARAVPPSPQKGTDFGWATAEDREMDTELERSKVAQQIGSAADDQMLPGPLAGAWPLATRRSKPVMAWPQWDEPDAVVSLLRLAAETDLGSDPEFCLCLRVDPDFDPPISAATATLLASASVLPPDLELELLLVEDPIPEKDWPRLGQAVVASLSPISTTGNVRRDRFFSALGRPLLADVGSVRSFFGLGPARPAASGKVGAPESGTATPQPGRSQVVDAGFLADTLSPFGNR